MQRFQTLLIDPPWPETISGRYKLKKHTRPDRLPYASMTIAEIESLPVEPLLEVGAHVWLWTTNRFLEDGFRILRRWGLKFLAPIHMIKPSGFGNYFVHRSQTCLFAYYKKCLFPNARYRPNILQVGQPPRHSEKPPESYELIEAVSSSPRLELFARRQRPGWDVWGNEVESTVELAAA